MNERPISESREMALNVGFWVLAAAKLPDGFRPKNRRSRGMLPVLEADILNRGSDTRKPPEIVVAFAASKPTGCDTGCVDVRLFVAVTDISAYLQRVAETI